MYEYVYKQCNSGKKFDDFENDVNVYGRILSEINYSCNKGKEELVKCAIANDQRIDEMNKSVKEELERYRKQAGYYKDLIHILTGKENLAIIRLYEDEKRAGVTGFKLVKLDGSCKVISLSGDNIESKQEQKNFEEVLNYYNSIIDECAEVSRTYLEPPVGTHGMKKEDLKNFLEYRTGLALDVIKNST